MTIERNTCRGVRSGDGIGHILRGNLRNVLETKGTRPRIVQPRYRKSRARVDTGKVHTDGKCVSRIQTWIDRAEAYGVRVVWKIEYAQAPGGSCSGEREYEHARPQGGR